MAIKRISLVPVETLKKYSEVLDYYKTKKYNSANAEPIYLQGEDADFKSDSTIYPVSDRSSSATQPSSSTNIVLNTIGGDRWKTNGQWIEWKFKVKESGLYKIAIKFRQNLINGALSYRSIYIDDTLLFDEMSSIGFSYDSSWQVKTLGGNEEPWKFYLEEGSHTLKMQVVLGDISQLVATVDNVIKELSKVHRSMLMVIGPDPDVNRDYQFDKIFKVELEQIKTQSLILEDVRKKYIEINGYSGEQAPTLESIIDQNMEMYKKPHKIVKLFDTFVNNISALGIWNTIAKQQPLEIDYICISGLEYENLKPNAGFLNELRYQLSLFFNTFVSDYSTVGSKDADITVWVGNGATGGRDQANVLNQLIKNYFTSKTGIKVKLQLVQMGSLLSASIAGKGPDVALTLTSVDAMNYALRGAVADLSGMPGFDEVKERFHPSALTPLTFRDKTFGVPETQTFPMMFYREDILQEIGIKVPQTWKEVITTLPQLQKKRLNFGLPIPISSDIVGVGFSTYAMFVMQNGGTIYTEDLSECNLDSDEAIDAFYQWTDFYSQYSVPLQYDAVNRFRMGEIPIMIADYSMYNMLSVFAPELEGLWSFAAVPGTERPDGTIDRTVVGNVAAAVILKNDDRQVIEKSWEFLKWWTSSEIQTMFAVEIESILGSAGRYAPANLESLYQIPWSAKDFNNLMSQWEWVKGVEEIPGSYMTSRYVDFAFKQVTIGQSVGASSKYKDPGQILINAVKTINSEIEDKYQEFGYSR